jgi:glycosyltransferase involved in cell wall biosynthesis
LKRVLLVQPSLNPPGGGNAVAAWMVQALRECCEVSVLAWSPPRLDPINDFYGTSLSATDFELHLVPLAVRRAVDRVPAPLALLKAAILRRALNSLRRVRHFDVLIGANNEFDFGCRGIQYVHYPNAVLPRPKVDYRWYHRLPGCTAAYRDFTRRLAGDSIERMRGNATLANSVYIQQAIGRTHAIDAQVLYPPVPGRFACVPWAEKKNGFVCAGRFAPEKELGKIIGLVSAVRARGHKVVLHMIGDDDGSAYAKRILAVARKNESWIQIHRDVSRDELSKLMTQHRYGIHGMVGEHFGIGVAEMQRAGCIVFAPERGGPAEIVGDSRVLYASAEDAIEKIDRVLGDSELQADLCAGVAARRDLFTEERFAAGIRRVVLEFESNEAPPASAIAWSATSGERNGELPETGVARP